jgi:hypothetical protein
MTVIKEQAPSEADLRRLLNESDDVRVRDTRSGCEGVLWRVDRASVIALMGHMTFRIHLAHLALADDEAAGGKATTDEAASSTTTW